MKGKTTFLLGFGAGYVLGAKAGTERYDQLRRLYDNLVASQGLREATRTARTGATTGLSQAKEAASSAVDKVRGRSSDDERTSLSVAPPPGS